MSPQISYPFNSSNLQLLPTRVLSKCFVVILLKKTLAACRCLFEVPALVYEIELNPKNKNQDKITHTKRGAIIHKLTMNERAKEECVALCRPSSPFALLTQVHQATISFDKRHHEGVL